MESDNTSYPSVSYLSMIWAGIASVGWYIVGASIALFFAAPYLEEKYTAWRSKKDEAEYAAKYHKNPDLLEEKLRGQEEARQKMQEKYNEAAQLAQELEEKRKQAKQEELAKLLENQTSGRRLGNSSESSSSSALKNDYNPLMGDSSRGYRPPKRSCCKKGGGCG